MNKPDPLFPDPLFDYAPILLRMDKICKELHHAALDKSYGNCLSMLDEMIVQSRMLRAWINEQKGEGNE